MWHHHRQCPSVLSQLRSQALKQLPFLLAVVLGLFLLSPGTAWAAEVLQVQGGSLLLVGDRNRTYGVQLACVQVGEAQQQGALQLTRQKLPRFSRVNLRPVGSSDGQLLAQVRILPGGEDLGSALVAAGLAEAIANDVRPDGCPAIPGS